MVYAPTMPLGDFVEAGTTPKPPRIGRTLRLVAGLGTTSYFVWNISNIGTYSDRIDTYSIFVGDIAGALVAWWFLSDAFVVGFGWNWARRARVVAIPVGVIAIIFSLIGYMVTAYPTIRKNLAWKEELVVLSLKSYFSDSSHYERRFVATNRGDGELFVTGVLVTNHLGISHAFPVDRLVKP